MAMDKQIFLVAQKDAIVDSPTAQDLYQVGTIATLLQLLHLPDGTVKVLVEGIQRAELVEYKQEKDYLSAIVRPLSDQGEGTDTETVVLMRSVLNQFEELVKLNKKIPPELIASLRNIEQSGNLADSIAAHMSIKIPARQEILEKLNVRERLELLHKLLAEELDLVEVEKRVQGRVKQQVEKSQRQYYLSEKIKAIQKELGEMEEGGAHLRMKLKNCRRKLLKRACRRKQKRRLIQN